MSATGGSGKYQFRMDAPSYSSPNQWAFESVADPSRGEWMNYTSECASNDYTFARQNKNALKDGTYTISSTLNNNYVLDIKNNSKADSGNVQLNRNNSSNSKEFIVTHDSMGYVTFTNVNSGKVLDVSSGKVENGRNIQQYLSNGTKAQKWIVEKKKMDM